MHLHQCQRSYTAQAYCRIAGGVYWHASGVINYSYILLYYYDDRFIPTVTQLNVFSNYAVRIVDIMHL